jgi:hypothetical protein
MKLFFIITLFPLISRAGIIGEDKLELISQRGDIEFLEAEINLSKLNLIKWRHGYAIDDENISLGFKNRSNLKLKRGPNRCQVRQYVYKRTFDEKIYTMILTKNDRKTYPCMEFKYDTRDKLEIVVEDLGMDLKGAAKFRIGNEV